MNKYTKWTVMGFYLFGLCVSNISLAESTFTGDYIHSHKIFLYQEDHTKEFVTATDDLTISANQDGGYQFSVNTVANNGHTCEVIGQARKEGNYLEFKTTFKSYSKGEHFKHCTLRIRNNNGAKLLEDVDNQCRLNFCGMRAYLDGITFHAKMPNTENSK